MSDGRDGDGSHLDLTAGVAVRVSALCLQSKGRLSDRRLASDAVRAGLVLDLALAGRLTSTDESIVIDQTPTGFLPADRLLTAVAAESERSLDEWLGEPRIGLRDVADANVASGRWELRRGLLGLRPRYVDRHHEQTARDLARSESAWPADASPDDACVTVVAGASGLLDRDFGLGHPPSAAEFAASGDVAWLCTAVAEHLQRAADRYRTEAAALSGGGAFY